MVMFIQIYIILISIIKLFFYMLISENISLLVKSILDNKVVAIPTETVFGLSCRINTEVISKIVELKSRSFTKGFILLGSSWDHISPYINEEQLPQEVFEKKDIYSEPTTWIVPASNKAISVLTGGRKTIAVRITRNSFLQNVCDKINQGIITTSANMSGESPAISDMEVCKYFPKGVDFVYKKTIINPLDPSRIVDIITGQFYR